MRYYIAIVHKDADSDFGISFPDLPGCVSAGTTLEDAVAMGREALEGHFAVLAEEGEVVPEPSSMDVILSNPENRDGTPVVIPAPPVSPRTVRVNITLPEMALREIDAYAEAHGQTRSGFLVAAARSALRAPG